MLIVDDTQPADVLRARPVVAADWTERLHLPRPYTWREGESFPWAASSFGPGATVHRFFIDRDRSTNSGTIAAVNVITVKDPGRLRSYPSGLLYPTDPPLRYGKDRADLPDGVAAIVQYSDSASQQGPDDPLWVMLTWRWTLSDNRVQRVTVVVSQEPDRPNLLPTPRQPSVAVSLLMPMMWILQSRRSDVSILVPQAMDVATDIASELIRSAAGSKTP